MSQPSSVIPTTPPASPSFIETTRMFGGFVARLRPSTLPAPAAGAARAAVIVTPWCSCPVPWWALTTACLLRREGVDVTLVWNDVCDMVEPATFDRENQLIGAFLRHFQTFPIVRLSEQTPRPGEPLDVRSLDAAALANAIWQNRGSLPRERVSALQEQMAHLLARSLPHVEALFARHRFDFALVPGGQYGNSGLLTQAGERRGVRMTTYDANPGNILIGIRGTAGCCPDVPRCVEEAPAHLGDKQERARSIARDRLRERMAATEKFFTEPGYVGQPVQMLSLDQDRNTYNDEVVIPLNVEWDAAALGLHRFFRDDCEWTMETVAHLLENTGARVTIRQHPGNRVVVDGAANLEGELARRFSTHPRYRFVRAKDPVNTYKLLAGARVVLPFTSTMGIEAAMLGKPVVLESRAYYAGMSFAETIGDKQSYFKRIIACLEQPPPPDSRKIAEAELCYFFAAVCNFVPTIFTPHPDDFAQWSQLPLDALAADDGVRTILRAIKDEVPAAITQSAARLRVTPVALSAAPTFVSPPPPPPLEIAPADRMVSPLGAAWPNYPGVTMGNDVQIIGVRNVEIGEGSCIGDFTWLNICDRDDKVRMRIGQRVLIGRQSMVSTGGYLEIGDFGLFGPRVTVVDADHGYSDISRPYAEQTPTLGRSIIIEENCWIAAGAVVAGHLTVGRGSVIGANAVVTQDVPPFSVVVGHPGRVVKMYDPVTARWEPVKTDEDRARVEANRARLPLPDRDQYRTLLRRNSRSPGVPPIVAGKGECL